MIAANLFDHPLVLLLIGLVALVRWLVSNARSRTENNQTPIDPPPAQPISRGGETRTEEERIRKFLEALGQPPGTTPPKVTPRPPQSVPPKIFPRLPPLKTAPPPLARQPAPVVVPPPLPVAAAPVTKVSTLEADYQVYEVARQTSSEPAPESSAASASLAQIKLGTPQDLRTAIVLREIFGPPRSLQPIDLTSGF